MIYVNNGNKWMMCKNEFKETRNHSLRRFRYNVKSYAVGNKLHKNQHVYYSWTRWFQTLCSLLLQDNDDLNISNNFYLYNIVQVYCVRNFFHAIWCWAEPFVCFVIKKNESKREKNHIAFNLDPILRVL